MNKTDHHTSDKDLSQRDTVPHDSIKDIVTDALDSIQYGFSVSKFYGATARVSESDGGRSGMCDDSLEIIENAVKVCAACTLHTQRTLSVPGEGVPNPLVMVIGEAPGAQEDVQGRPFVGAAGQYLDKWLNAIELSRTKNVFITNAVKCRPPNNRDPKEDEYSVCSAFLLRQVALLRPRCIVAVGRIAARLIIGADDTRTLSSMRGGTHYYDGTIRVFVTYHPSAVLRNDSLRRPVWDDLQMIKKYIDELDAVVE